MNQFILFPIVGALIGAFTNELAIRMLFRPYNPWYIGKIRIPMTPGVIPAQRKTIAANIAETFEKHLLSSDEIHKALTSEKSKQIINEKIDETLNQAKEVASKVEGMELDYTKRVGSNGKLFGAISANDIAKTLAEKGIEVEKRQIHVKEAIKAIGTFDVTANLFKGVEANFKVKVTMDPAQIEELKKKQAAAEKKAIARKEEAERKAAAGETEEGEEAEGENADGETSDETAESEV